MKTRAIGIIIVVIGFIMTIYTGFNYVTTEKVVDIGPVKINKEKNHPIQWKPIVGVIVMIGGVVIIEDNRRRNKG